MLYDADVLVWLTRGHSRAANVLLKDSDRRVSAIAYMELVQGARDQADLRKIQGFFAHSGIQIEPVTERISRRAMGYLENFSLGHGMEIPDALIAATSLECGLPLCTANVKHFRFIPNLSLSAFRP